MEKIKKAIRAINIICKDKNRKSIFIIFKEVAYCFVMHKEIPIHYFTHLLYRKDSGNYKDYISQKMIDNIKEKLFRATGRDNPNLVKKDVFSKILKRGDIPQPNVYDIIEKEHKDLNSSVDLKDYLLSLIRKNNIESLFIKPTDLNGGRGCFKIDAKTDDRTYQKILNLIQESLVQHPKINKIYDKSINTLRIHTRRKGNSIEVLSGLMRFGSGGSVVDNGSSGGMYVPVDINKKQLKGTGKTYFKSGGKIYTNHPATGTNFDSYELPYFDEVISLCKKSAKLFEDCIIGWDVAITEDGPKIIEGNGNPHLVMAQVSCKGFLKHEGFYQIFKNYI